MKKLLKHTTIYADLHLHDEIKLMEREIMERKIMEMEYEMQDIIPLPSEEDDFSYIDAQYFDSNKNRYLSLDVNKVNYSPDKKCSYCKKEPIKSYNIYKNKRGGSEAHFICSQNCSNKIFYNSYN
jgi:hypothetical protein